MAQNEIELALKDLLTNDMGDANVVAESWEAGFDLNRQIVVSKILFYKAIFLRPEHYVQRFHHTIHPLLVQDWEIIEQIELYDGFCSMDINLKIRFQATLKYVELNSNFLLEINQHIKSVYENQLLSIVYNELTAISDGAWLKKGLANVERKISRYISETFILHHVQAQVSCALKPNFKEFPHIELTKENINLSLAQKDFEIENKNRQELYRQEVEAEKNQQQQKRQLLEQLNVDLEIDRLKIALQAEHERLILVEKEGMQLDYFAIEERLCTEKVAHENRLKEIKLDAEFKRRHAQREATRKELSEALNYRKVLTEKQLKADIYRYEEQQKHWLAAKERVYMQRAAFVLKQEKLQIREKRQQLGRTAN
ncbi:MAG: hypothetical protein KAH08_05985 [Methylococcales bacterium]|nr:hypothetical protein [Methylococcales bacterium]